MKENKFILIDTGSESNRIMMSDVGKMDNGLQLSDVYSIDNKFLKKLHDIHFSYRLNIKWDLPGKAIWDRYCILENLVSDPDNEYFIVFVNNSVHKTTAKYLNHLNERKNVHLFVLLLDAYKDLPEYLLKRLCVTSFQRVYSFQASDCEQYGFRYVNTIYSKADVPELLKVTPTSDVYFVGADKGRIDEVYRIFQILVSNHLRCDFTIVVDKKKLKEYRNKYRGLQLTSNRLGYASILKGIFATRCILELCQRGQDGLTMRFYEAVFYNKKLMTNNETAKSHPLYDTRFMRVFQDGGKIDVQFLIDNSIVEYHYQNQMSPKLFMEQLPLEG